MRHGSNLNPKNRFESVHLDSELGDVEWDTEYLRSLDDRKIEYLDDDSATIVAKNSSPDLPFNYSLNPYRGCVHACTYCYARPTHEYLGFNAGMDFETKIVVKQNAPELFRKFLSKKSWQPEPIAFSGVTDCYQPAERNFRLTRQCLEIAAECNQPISIVTKNALVVRDMDILQSMAERNLVHVSVSVTTLNNDLARDMEPRTSIPSARLRAIQELADADIPTGVMIAPVIPGLNDFEIPEIMKACKEAGALMAGYVLLRLPLTVKPVFEEWLNRTHPDKAEMVFSRIKQTRGGNHNDSTWGQRMTGSGEIAWQIKSLFKTFQKKHGLDNRVLPHNCENFVAPASDPRQKKLF